jgi:hypothetical protein
MKSWIVGSSFLIALLGCSPSTPPDSTPLAPLLMTVVFPTIDRYAEVDTAIVLKLWVSHVAVKLDLPDSNWKILQPVPTAIAPDSTLRLTIAFAPLTGGFHSGSLTVTSLVGSYSCRVDLSGTAVDQKQNFNISSIDFGRTPLWREYDTLIHVRAKTFAPITLASFSDSNYRLSSWPTISADSILNIKITYQPRSLNNHVGTVAIFSYRDTLALLHLSGGASPFSRRIGDSYIFEYGNSLDSIVIVGSNQFISTADSGLVDTRLKTAELESDGDMIISGMAWGRDVVKIPIETFLSYHGGTQDEPFGHDHYNGAWSSMFAGDSLVQIGGYPLIASVLDASSEYTYVGRGNNSQGREHWHMTYAREIGFFTSIQAHYDGGTSNSSRDESYRLIRFHLFQR